MADVLNSRVKEELGRVRATRPVSQLKQVNNPFIYRGPLWTVKEVLTVLVFGLWLVPLRIFIFMLAILPSYLLLRISVSCGFDPAVPMTGWRRAMQVPVAFIVRAVLYVLGVYWVETTGELCKPSEAKTVVCAPHSTFLDTFFLVYWLRLPCAISKLENISYPLAGVLFRGMQVITVDRSSKENRHLAFEQMKFRAQDEREKRHLLVFPEGTCTNREALITFKLGAFAAGKPVQPVALEWPYSTGFDLTWTNTSKHSRLVLALHLLCQPIVRCRVHFLPVYYPTTEEQEDVSLFARNVRQVLATKLDLPTTEHSIEDMFLAKEARKLDLDLPFEMQEMQNLFEIDLQDAKKLLRRYGKLFRNRKEITSQEFATLLGVDHSSTIEDMFTLLKNNEESTGIDFKQFLIGVCQISQALNTCDLESSVDLVWQACGGSEDKSGALSLTELRLKLVDIFPGKLSSATVKRMFAGSANSGKVDYASFNAALREQSPFLFAAMGALAQHKTTLQILQHKESQV